MLNTTVNQGYTIVFITHKLNEVMALCDRITVKSFLMGWILPMPLQMSPNEIIERGVGYIPEDGNQFVDRGKYLAKKSKNGALQPGLVSQLSHIKRNCPATCP